MNIMNAIKQHINQVFFILLSLIFVIGCDDNTTSLQLSGDTWLKSFKVDDYQGTIDNSNKTVVIEVPVAYNTEAMKITEIEVSEGAEASMTVGDVIDFSFSHTIKVISGDAFLEYTVTVKHEEAKISSFKLNGSYEGIIDEENHSILVRIPTSADITSLIPTIETTTGATVSPIPGQAVDFTEPVEFTITYKSATSTYMVTVEKSDSPLAVYVGLATSVNDLNAEEKEAAQWLLDNIPNSQYLSFDDVRTGRVDLSGCKVMWWHLHIDGGIDTEAKFDAAVPSALQAVAQMKEFYNNGGSLLLTRFATFYAAKLGVTIDGKIPNNCWGGIETSPETTTSPWSFLVTEGQENHPLYSGVTTASASGKYEVYTCDAGYKITNSSAQWHIGTDWGDYPDLNTWIINHGATSLGNGGDGAVVVWEYPSTATSGSVLCIGSGCYDWYADRVNVSNDQYHGNVAKLTENAIEYLMDQSKN